MDMRKLLLIISLFCIGLAGFSQTPMHKLIRKKATSGPKNGDILARFNFNETAQSVSGWTDVSGQPHTAIRTATGTNSIAVSSLATGEWGAFSSISANNSNGEAGGTYFPSTVMQSFWVNYSFSWASSADNNLRVSGLTPGQLYSFEISGSWNTAITGSLDGTPTCVRVNNGSCQTYNANDNTSTGLIVTGTADASGYVYFWIGQVAGSSNGGFIGGMIVYFGSIL